MTLPLTERQRARWLYLINEVANNRHYDGKDEIIADVLLVAAMKQVLATGQVDMEKAERAIRCGVEGGIVYA